MEREGMAGSIGVKVKAQGRLFEVALYPTRKRSTRGSVAQDWNVWIEGKYDARKLLMNIEDDEYREIYRKLGNDNGSRLIELLAEKIVHKNMVAMPKRGIITSFSRKSRLRLLKLGARLNIGAGAVFVTLTYRKNMTDAVEAKRHLALICLRLKRKFNGISIIWRMEFQERGAIHFHLIVFNRRYIKATMLTQWWQDITGDDAYPDVQALRTGRQAMYYMSKYLAKDEQAASTDGLDNEPYSDTWIGRFWGIVGRKYLPLADEIVIEAIVPYAVLFTMRRYALRYYRRMSRRLQSFTLFCEANRWMQVMLQVLLEHTSSIDEKVILCA